MASATESLYILVGLTLKLGHCITVFVLGWNTGLWFAVLGLVAWKVCFVGSVFEIGSVFEVFIKMDPK